MAALANLDSWFGDVNVSRQLLPHNDIRVMRFGECVLQYL